MCRRSPSAAATTSPIRRRRGTTLRFQRTVPASAISLTCSTSDVTSATRNLHPPTKKQGRPQGRPRSFSEEFPVNSVFSASPGLIPFPRFLSPAPLAPRAPLTPSPRTPSPHAHLPRRVLAAHPPPAMRSLHGPP